jgi:hypothetical protein
MVILKFWPSKIYQKSDTMKLIPSEDKKVERTPTLPESSCPASSAYNRNKLEERKTSEFIFYMHITLSFFFFKYFAKYFGV